jgi:DNA (cytosine-5)-methyltransferase 1
MSWLFSQALVVEYLGDTYLDGEPSALLSGNNTQLAYLPQDKMTDFSRLSRFGMMFKPLTENLGEELLMSYLGDFHAKTSLPLEKETDLTENGQECGKRWQGLLARYDQNTHSLRTVQCSLLEDLNESLQTWPRWGSMRNGECFQQPMLEQTIKETEFGLLEKVPNNLDFFHTPCTTGIDGGSNSQKALKKRMEQWPTPVCSPSVTSQTVGATLDLMNSREREQGTLMEAVVKKMFPTPQASDNRDRGNMSNPSIQRRIAKGKQIMLSQSVDQNSGQLNPMWVEWLMGWLPGWTDLKPLEMDKSLYVQQQHGNS